ncbi:lamin tail domain-containing protein, partial [Flavobacterium sp.]
MKNNLLFKNVSRNVLLFCFLLCIVVTSNTYSQIAAWQLNGAAGDEVTVVATTVNANLNNSLLRRGSGVLASSLGNSFSSTDFNSGTKASAITSNEFVSFTLNSKPGYKVSVSTLDAKFRRSGTGPNTFRWQFSIDGSLFTDVGTSDISYTGTTSGGNAQTSINLATITALQNVSSNTTITIRLLAWGASASGGTFAIGRSTTTGAADYSLSVGGALSADISSPSVTTAASATLITTNSATLSGNVTSDGGDPISGRGIVYASTLTNNNPSISGTGVVNLSTSGTTGNFSVTESSLNVNTSYSYKAYAINSIGTSYGQVKSFYTYANVPSVPTISSPTNNSLNITLNSGDGNPSNTQYAIQVNGSSYVQADGTLDIGEIWQTASTWSTKTVIGLSSVTEYSFVVKARNGDGVETAYSNPAYGTTLANVSATFESDLLDDFASVCINDNVINNFTFIGYNLNNATISVGPVSGYTFAKSMSGSYASTINYNADVNGELAETVFVKFSPTSVLSYDGNIAISGGGAASINVAVSGSGINSAAQISTGASSLITATSATATGTVVNGCSSIISSGIEYSVTNEFTISNFVSGLPAALTELAPNTIYFYRAVIIDATGTIYGAADSFTTTVMSSPLANSASDIETTQFIANWNSVAGASSYRLDVSVSPTFLTTTPTSNLIISEYGEGNGGNKKYIEIYNGTGTTVDLANYEIWKNVNGSNWNFQSNNTTPTVPLSLSGTLINGGTYVIANNPTDVVGANLYSVFLSFNGDDATGLAWNGGNGTIFSLLDVVGQEGTDPGSGWTVAGISNATADKILIRKPTVITPNTDWSTSAGTNDTDSEWIVSSFTYNNTNQTTDLGLHTIDSTSPSFVFGYEDLQVFGTSQLVSGLMASTNYFYRVRAESSNDLSNNSNRITVLTSATPPTFGAIIQSVDVACENTSVNFFITGLIPNSVSTLTYAINGGPDLALTNVVANGSGFSQVGIVLQSVNNGQTLIVNTIQRTDVASAQFSVNENNSVVLQVSANATFYADNDNDGYGVTTSTIVACERPTGYATLSGDCNDGDSAVNPGKTEVCWN